MKYAFHSRIECQSSTSVPHQHSSPSTVFVEAFVKIHGGPGYSRDYYIHLYFKRVKASDAAFGNGNYHSEPIAQYLEQV
jgi:hypothetical protein